MNITFVYSLNNIQSPLKPLQTPEQSYFGISYLSSFLKTRGHRTDLIVLSEMSSRKNFDILEKHLKDFNPGLICFTAVATEYKFIAKIAAYIKKHHKAIYLLCGGPHVSLNAQEAISDDFEALCIGEGEFPTLELVSQLEKGIHPSGIPNLWIKNGSAVEKNPIRPFLEELDILPFPDREIWQKWIDEEPGSRYSILLGRGCPFQCTYCCNHAFKKLAKGNYVRFRSAHNILEEIKELVAKVPKKKEFFLEVETIGVDEKWVTELCLSLEKFNATLKEPLCFETNLRLVPNLELNNLLSNFKKANFRAINIGLESGSERIRHDVLKRNYSNTQIIAAVKLAREYGFKIHFYNLIGIPGETINDFNETVKINRICSPDKVFTSIFFPYPGTDLYEFCKKNGLLKYSYHTRLERTKACLDLPTFRRQQIQKKYIWFSYIVYKGQVPVYKLLLKVFAEFLKSNYYLTYLYRKLTCIPVLKHCKYSLKNQ